MKYYISAGYKKNACRERGNKLAMPLDKASSRDKSPPDTTIGHRNQCARGKSCHECDYS